jgi:hypothetical protein
MLRNRVEGEYMFLRSSDDCGRPSGVCIHEQGFGKHNICPDLPESG